MCLEERFVDDVGGVENLLGDQFSLPVFAVGVLDSGHPIRGLQTMMIPVGRVLGLAVLGGGVLDKPDVLEFAPHLREKIRRHVATDVIDQDVFGRTCAEFTNWRTVARTICGDSSV